MKLTPKQKKFVDIYLDCGNASEAVRQSYDLKKKLVRDETGKIIKNDNAALIACQTLKSKNVRDYLEKVSVSAVERIERLSREALNESVRLSANKDLLDRAGYKPAENVDITSKGEKIEKMEEQITSILNIKDVSKQKNSGTSEELV